MVKTLHPDRPLKFYKNVYSQDNNMEIYGTNPKSRKSKYCSGSTVPPPDVPTARGPQFASVCVAAEQGYTSREVECSVYDYSCKCKEGYKQDLGQCRKCEYWLVWGGCRMGRGRWEWVGR